MTDSKSNIKDHLFSLFNLLKDKEDEIKTIESLRQDVEFRGTKMWILICAIFIASLGLNMNSTAVIIGAMLISPLMGPIIGLGLGLGITDFNLVKKSLKHFGFATLVSIITSTLYFLISPIDIAQSELLSRTQPTTYDVFIALVGGFAGIIAGASKFKGNVIPGVAIATALMPPLCTAGFGLGTGQFHFFFGAFYLYIINAVFIALATFITVKALKYPRMSYIDPAKGKRLNNLVIVIVLFTLIPSILLAAQMVRKSLIDVRAQTFVSKEIAGRGNNYVLSYDTEERNDSSFLYVSLLGDEIPAQTIELLQAKLPSYRLDNTYLVIRQGFSNSNIAHIKKSILTDIDKKNSSQEEFIHLQTMRLDSLQRIVDQRTNYAKNTRTISLEITRLFPSINRAEFSKGLVYDLDTKAKEALPSDSLSIITLHSSSRLTNAQKQTIENWLKLRLPNSKVTFTQD